jgi:hypothetical protein
VSIVTKQAAVSPGRDDGTFDAILSTPSVDRDGESLGSHHWKQPLPASIAITVDHTGSVADVVASGQPYLADDGSLRLKGRFASTDKGQQIRQLVVGGHINALSVEFLRRKSSDGTPVNELTAASFVLLPSNVDAVVLSAKSFSEQLDIVVKAASAGEDVSAMVRAIHDAAVHLGAQCVPYVDDVNPDGSLDDDSMDGESGESDGANKAVALRLRLKALSR